MIDVMAGFRFPKSTQEILEYLQERTGAKHGHRTVERDLWLLESMGLVAFNGRRDAAYGPGPHTYKLNLALTETLQAAALRLVDKEQSNAG